jgi:valyl-tRNA synthetase
MELEKAFDPHGIESRWYPFWESKGYFKAGFDPARQSFSIQLPPPNVTGTLHMGHAYQQTLMDVLTRYHRMKGFNVLWQPGTDHAGIATQMVVERQLEAEGTSRRAMGRDAFVKRVWEWKEKSGSTITRQMRRLGASCDWSREYFTMDAPRSRAVTEVFVRLFEQGLIYRGKRLVSWDPVLQTAVSDLEVESSEENGTLWHLRYPLEDGSGHIVVATTRPETMLGDVAVAVHPDDERYAKLVGKPVRLPLADRLIPVIADTYVDREFGTGVVKITPAHDFNDFQVGVRHGLAPISIFTLEARVNENAPLPYHGLDRFEARKRVLADLEKAGLVESKKPHKLMVPRSQRTEAIVEPMLSDQWFVRMRRRAWKRSGRATPVSCRPNGPRSTTSGWRTSRTGASRDNSGGDTRSPPGTRTTARLSWGAHSRMQGSTRPRRARRSSRKGAIPTCSTHGSRRRWYPSRRSAGPTRRSSSASGASTCPPRCSSPDSTSSSSGSRA